MAARLSFWRPFLGASRIESPVDTNFLVTILKSALWVLMRNNYGYDDTLAKPHAVSAESLREKLLALPKRYTAGWLRVDENRTFWRNPEFDAARLADRAVMEGTLDCAAVLLLLVDDALLRQDELQHFLAWRSWARLAERGGALGIVYPEFFCKVISPLRDVRYSAARPRGHLEKAARYAEELAMLEIATKSNERFKLLCGEPHHPLGRALDSEQMFLLAMSGDYERASRRLERLKESLQESWR